MALAKDNAWMANWLALGAAIIIALVQSLRPSEEKFNWARLVIYFAFLSSFAVVLTPTFDFAARLVSEGIALLAFIYIFIEALKRLLGED